MTPVVLQGVALDDPTLMQNVVRIVAFILAAGVASALTALVFRWFTREPVPVGVSTVLGLSVVALYLNTVGLFSQLVGGASATIFELDAVVFNVVAIGLAAFATPLGRQVGDRAATDVFAVTGAKELDAEVSRIVRTVGRVTQVTLPEADDIKDMESYDPVSAEVKTEMGEKALLFPNRLTVEELHDRLITRLKEDYRIGHVDVEVTADGTIEYLAVGMRASGLGPTLGHGTVAVSVRADPANGASPGDTVQVWRPARTEQSEGTDAMTQKLPERLLTAELRAASDDVVTLAVDEADANQLDTTTNYRLVSLPAEPQVDKEFASLLRAADETMAAVTVAESSGIVGETLESLDATVAAVRPATGPAVAIPPRARLVEPGDTLYIVARPEVLRRLESRANVIVERPPVVEAEVNGD